MGKDTKIAWATDTFNIVWGCTKLSEACRFCYAEGTAKRWGFKVWGQDMPRRQMSDAYWREPLKWEREAAASGQPRRVFCSSMADVFEDHPELVAPRRRLFELIDKTPHLTWLLLTKRADRMRDLARDAGWSGAWPVNVWAGVTVENQRRADERIPHLLQVPARVRFLSCEPLLESIDLSLVQVGEYGVNPLQDIAWVIVGGESGPSARPFDLAWARQLRHQCNAGGSTFFFKQAGARPIDSARVEIVGPNGCVSYVRPTNHPDALEAERTAGYIVRPAQVTLRDRAGADPAEWPVDLQVQEFPSP